MLTETIKEDLFKMPHDEQNVFLGEVINAITISRKNKRAELTKKLEDLSEAERNFDKEILRAIKKGENE